MATRHAQIMATERWPGSGMGEEVIANTGVGGEFGGWDVVRIDEGEQES